MAAGQEDELLINLDERTPLDLTALVRWLSEVRGMQIFDYGVLEGKTNSVRFFGQRTVDRDTMFELVQGILRSNGLAIVEAEVVGWHRIVPLAGVRPFVPVGQPGDFERGEYLTAVFTLQHVSPVEVDTYLRQLVYTGEQDSAAGSITPLPAQNTIIITETAQKLATISNLIEQLDIPKEETVTEFYKVEHLEASELEAQLNDLLNSAAVLPEDNSSPTPERLRIRADLRTNRLIMIGSRREIAAAMELIRQLDVAMGLTLERYQLKHISGERIDELIRQTLTGLDEEAIGRVYQSSFNEQSNQLIVTARPEIHNRILEFIEQLDREVPVVEGQSPIRFYTLKNVKAIDILDTLQSIVGRLSQNPYGRTRQRSFDRINGRNTGIVRNDIGLPFGGGAASGFGSSYSGQPGIGGDFFQASPGGIPRSRQGDIPPALQGALSDGLQGVDTLLAAAAQNQNVIPGEARVTIDETSNTLIVVADPAVQQLYADLIEKLDQRRPQVLIEVSVVTISANDNFNFGIEVSGGDSVGDNRLFAFSSFGLSAVDSATGGLSLLPGRGFNGTLVDPDVADVVLRALASHSRSRVISAPRILVTDNATGLLSSVAEEPFSSINANNTVSTRSLGGFAQAGTTISVTPQISDDDYINLEFDVLVNNFADESQEDLPPPRNTDQVTSEVSIPDGHTIIVGGLKRRQHVDSVTGIPILERIPVVNRLTSRQGIRSVDQHLFVFIKPIILRDDKFRDLRFLSELERREACIPDDLPQSGPALVR